MDRVFPQPPYYSSWKRGDCRFSDSRKLLRPTPTKRKRCPGPREIRSRSDRAMAVNSSQDDGGVVGVWLRERMLNSLVFSFKTTVRATRASWREADHTFCARR